MIALFTGGRYFEEYSAVVSFMDALYLQQVVVGDCPTGLDMCVRDYCHMTEREPLVGVADWEKYGKAAGPIRNKWMLDNGKPNIVFAFPGGRGTQDMIMQAKAYGCPVFKVCAA